jgi:hypothetical protein
MFLSEINTIANIFTLRLSSNDNKKTNDVAPIEIECQRFPIDEYNTKGGNNIIFGTHRKLSSCT